MKQYYLMGPGDTEQDAYLETNLLGVDNGFGTFWSGQGLSTLMKAVDRSHDILNHLIILDDKRKEYSIEEFLTAIKKLKIRYER